MNRLQRSAATLGAFVALTQAAFGSQARAASIAPVSPGIAAGASSAPKEPEFQSSVIFDSIEDLKKLKIEVSKERREELALLVEKISKAEPELQKVNALEDSAEKFKSIMKLESEIGGSWCKIGQLLKEDPKSKGKKEREATDKTFRTAEEHAVQGVESAKRIKKENETIHESVDIDLRCSDLFAIYGTAEGGLGKLSGLTSMFGKSVNALVSVIKTLEKACLDTNDVRLKFQYGREAEIVDGLIGARRVQACNEIIENKLHLNDPVMAAAVRNDLVNFLEVTRPQGQDIVRTDALRYGGVALMLSEVLTTQAEQAKAKVKTTKGDEKSKEADELAYDAYQLKVHARNLVELTGLQRDAASLIKISDDVENRSKKLLPGKVRKEIVETQKSAKNRAAVIISTVEKYKPKEKTEGEN